MFSLNQNKSEHVCHIYYADHFISFLLKYTTSYNMNIILDLILSNLYSAPEDGLF